MLDTPKLESICKQLGIFKIKPNSKVLTTGGQNKKIDVFVSGFPVEKFVAIPEVLEIIGKGKPIHEIKEMLIEALMSESRGTKKAATVGSDWLDPAHFFPIHDVASDQIVIFNRQGGRAGMDPKVYAKRLGVSFQDVYDSSPVAYIEYAPFTTETVFKKFCETVQREIVVANSYVAPSWSLAELEEPVMHPILIKFFKHLLPIEEERNAVFHWMYFALTDRAQTILCVPGIQGIGKTILGERILLALFGRENWEKAPRSFMSKEFNSYIEDRRIVLVEEVPTPRSKEDRIFANEMLKDITNNVVTIEGKGKDARTINNTANFILTSNKLRAIPLDSPIDRRFLCVSTSKIRLETAMTEAERDELFRVIEPGSKEIAQLAAWILEFGMIEGHNAHYNLKNEIKYQIYRMSLSRWEMNLLKFIDKEKVKNHGTFKEEDLEKAVKKEKVKISTIEEFLDNFQMPSGNVIGHWDEKYGVFLLSGEALKHSVYVNPRNIQHEIFGDEILLDESEEADIEFFMKHGMGRAEYLESQEEVKVPEKKNRRESAL